MKQIRTLLVAALFVSLTSVLAQPANDNFSSAFTLTGTTVTTNGTTTSATKETGEPLHAGNGGGHSIWYRWTAPQTGSVTLTLSATYRDLLAVYTGSAVGSLTPVASAASGTGSGNVGLSFPANVGTTYRIAVDARNNAGNVGGPFTLGLQMPTVLIRSNTVWRFVPGTNEASNPIEAWRQLGFDDSSWSNSPTPFYYGDPYTNATTGTGTFLSDMNGNYQCVYLRHAFVISSPATVSNFVYRHQSDDGFVAWINGAEVLRRNMAGAPSDPPYLLPTGVNTANEPNNNGAAYISVTNTAGLASLVPGTNILAVQAFNVELASSTDFGFNMQFEAVIVNVDPTNFPPRITTVSPAAGDIFSFNSFAVTFSERVVNVDSSDLLINGVPATGVGGSGSNYTFTFSQPAYGPVSVTWATGHGIVDFDSPPKPFDGTGPGATFSYTLINPSAPTIFSKTPLAGSTVSNLTQIIVMFSEPVANVNASDLRINGAAATGLSGSGANYTFTFPQPAYGNVAISWAAGHGITDAEPARNPFDATRPNATWQYTLVDSTPPIVASRNPPAGANVTNLIQLSMTFSEDVQGVNAADLVLNGVAATSFSGSGSTYTFSFAQPNASVVNVNWALNHGIVDTAGNALDRNGPGATWQYFTPDNVPPVVASVSPPQGSTVRSLSQVAVTFSEPVSGVSASDLRINNVAATQVAGSSAGPYTFQFTQPPTGAVQIIWAAGHGIADHASPSNAFAGGQWTYTLNPNAVFADKVVINEIMFQPPSRRTNEEWIELHNTDSAPININGWRLTKGIDFTFPNVSIPAGGYLVVAADTNAFSSIYPGFTNGGPTQVVGNWSGNLANNDQAVQLETALGENVNEVHYASEGDWAVRTRGPLLSGHRGWIWLCEADGLSKTFELMNPAMPNKYGQNWRSSITINGTPGAANSVASTNVPPLILDMAHFPVVPRSTDPVVVTAKILDERTNGLTVTLFYRNAATLTPAAFTSLQMFDDGAHNDGVFGDKVFAATVPAQTNDAVIEFYVQAVDLDGHTNTYPAAAIDENGVSAQYANALYQVDDRIYTFAQPLYKFIMTETERQEREQIAQFQAQSDAEMNNTFISIDGTGTEVRYNCSLRERGAGSRGYIPANQRVNVPTDRRWKGQRAFNLNTRFTEAQYAGYLLSLKSGLDTENARIVRVRLNNGDQASPGSPQFGCYIHVEAPNSDMAEDHFPLDPDGNLYRASDGPHRVTLEYLGTNSLSYSSVGYGKASNASEDDYSDLANLTFVLNNAPDSNYTEAVRQVLNVEQWMLYFAMDALLVNMETALGNGDGDDYGMYRGVSDPRFILIAHDWDTVLGQGDTPGSTTAGLFRMDTANLPWMNRFIHWPEFEPVYYDTLRRLCLTTFSPAQLGKALDEGLGSFVPQNVIDNMKAFGSNRVDFVLLQLPAATNLTIIASNSIGGTLGSNVTFAAANGPYQITNTLGIPNGVTLTIQPGTTLQIVNGANITVANGARIVAEGTASSPILFTRSGVSGNWGHITINGAVGSPESRIAHARIEFNANNTGTPAIEVAAGTAFLDHLTFGNTGAPYIHVDGASFVISHCEFPSATAQFELVHGNGGIKSGGRGILYRNWFGVPIGYNDVVDFTGGNRPGQPTLHFIDNVFIGATDDILDLDGTDAWIEGNIFLHTHKNGSPDSASAISGGLSGSDRSELTIVGNIIFDCDQAANAKEGNFYTFFNNTIVRTTRIGGTDTNSTVLLMADVGTDEGAGAYFEGNIIHDAERLVFGRTNSIVTFSNNILSTVSGPAWTGPGGSNTTSAPLFKHLPTLVETANFTNWASAQILRDWLSLLPGSPGAGSGPNGTDKGGILPLGATVLVQSGATMNDAVLRVGINRAGSGIPASSWVNGSGYTHYKWRLDGGPWSAETPIGIPINLSGFRSGTHRVDVSGKRDTGVYQDNPDFGELALVTSVFNDAAQGVRLNEVLASNENAVNHEGTHPDVIELYNANSTAVDISGLRLTDDQSNPDKFIFGPGTTIPAGGYLVVYANNPDGTSGIHVGFNINKDGQSIYLFDTVDRGGVLIDSITLGLQVSDYSVGRVGMDWTLCGPTFGAPNVAAITGDPTRLVINEILTAELVAFSDDFVEIYNSQSTPVSLAGLFFTDNPTHWPNRSPVPALTFIEPNSYIAFRADGSPEKGADHLNFSLAAERGLVALLNFDYSLIDCLVYGPQSTDVSQGRSPSNGAQTNLFTTPTPGAANPGVIFTNQGVVINEVLAANSTIIETSDGSTPDWIEFFNNSTNAVDFGDYSLSDTSLTPRKYAFAPGTIIAGRGYLRLRCDGGQLPSSTNTGFNIKAESGSLFLFNKLANGGALLSSVTYGLQATDFSISRVPDGTGAWVLSLPTANGGNIPASLAGVNSLKINEWMAGPSSGEDWFELWNPNPQPVAIGGYFLTDDLNSRTKSPIPALSFLGASTNGYQRFWADSSPASGANHANFKLSNGGESIGFANPSGTFIDSITFAAQQSGVSEGRFPDGTATIVRFPGTESPGDANYLLITNVVINEALTHTDPPFEDAIELRNLTASPVNIGNWWLSDAKSSPRKYRIASNVTIPANGFVVFYEYQFNSDPTNDPTHSFSLSSAKGDQIYLSIGDANGNLTGYRRSVDFGAAQNGVSFGRYVTSDNNEEFVAMSARSLGQDDPGNVTQFRTGTGLANPYPKVGPIVISQIMYHPPDIGTNDNTLDEFIELRNITGAAVTLYDTNLNTWRFRDAVDFDFPQGVSLPAGGNLLVVSFDPVNSPSQLAAFRSKYGVNASVPVYGPYTGKLANGDDKVELYRPDNPDAGFVPFVLSDRVHYRDLAPWPAAADGSGAALRRVSLTGFGNDPTNWVAAIPNFGGGADSDGDGIPDSWENQYGLNPTNANDAALDLDRDGLSNLQEYLAGTNPTSANSTLRIISVENVGGNNVRLTFFAVSNKTYTVEFKNALTDPSWSHFTSVSAAPLDRLVPIQATMTTNRFYRVRTP